MADGRSAAGERTQTINQARALVLTGPDDLRARFTGHTAAALVAGLASLRPRPGSTVGYATRIALRELGLRAEFPGGQLERPGELIGPLVAARAPGLLASAGSHPRRTCRGHRRPRPRHRRELVRLAPPWMTTCSTSRATGPAPATGTGIAPDIRLPVRRCRRKGA